MHCKVVVLRLIVLLGVLGIFTACIPPGTLPPPSPPTSAEAADKLIQEAEGLYRSHRYNEAQPRYERYMQSYSHSPDYHLAWLRTAELMGIRGDWARSRNRLERLLDTKPPSSIALQARYGIGRAYFKQGNYPEAIQVLENLTASSITPELRFKIEALLAEIALKQGQITNAFVHLNLAEKDLEAGESEWFQDLKTRLTEQADVPQLEKLVDLYRDAPLSAALLLQLAKLEGKAGKTDKAGEWLSLLTQRFPSSPEADQARRLLSPVSTPPVTTGSSIACLLPLTGDYADTGTQVKEGMELAAAQAGLNLIIKDIQNDAAAAAKAVEELAQDKNLKVLVGPMTSATAEAAAQVAQRLNIPIITLTQKKDITALGPMVFRDFMTGRMQVKALIEYNARTLNLQRYGVLYPESNYGQTFLRLFDEELANRGGLLVSQVAYPEGGQDVAEAIATLSRAYRPYPDASPAFEALFIPDDAPTVLKLASELSGSPLAGVRLVGTNLMYSSQVDSRAPAALKGLLFPEAFFVGDSDPEIKGFVEAYKNKYSSLPHYLAAQGYSSIKIASELLKKLPDAGREELARGLADLRPISGIPLFRGFNAEREAELNIKILTIRDGQMKIAP